jgi:hypothetical protein
MCAPVSLVVHEQSGSRLGGDLVPCGGRVLEKEEVGRGRDPDRISVLGLVVLPGGRSHGGLSVDECW